MPRTFIQNQRDKYPLMEYPLKIRAMIADT
jgi:hypothetical protein